MLTPSGIGTLIAATGLLGAGAALNYPELVQVGIVGLGAVALSVGLAWRRPRVDVRVRLPDDRAVDGEAPRLLVTLTNRGRWRCFETRLLIRVGDVPVNLELDSVRAGAGADFAPPLPLLRRGVYPLSGARLGYRDPFDFARANHPVAMPSETLYIYPRTEIVAPMPAGGPQNLDGRPLNPVTGGDAFYSLREYTPGDSWRDIHWPTTARQATLMVRHTTIPEETAHAVVLDTERQAYAEQECFEQAVRIAASMCQAALRAGHSLSLVAGTESAVQAPAEQRHDDPYGPALNLLAGVRWTETGVDRRVLGLVPSGARLMVVTGRPTPALTGWLADLTRYMAASHLVQVLDPAQRPVDAPAGVCTLTVDGLDGFCATWPQWSRS